MRAAFIDAARLHQETIATDGKADSAAVQPYEKVTVEAFQTGATAAQVRVLTDPSRALPPSVEQLCLPCSCL